MTRETLDALESLTPAQRRVLVAILLGDSAEEAANRLGLAYNTVNNHMRRVREAFGGESLRKIVSRFVVIPEFLRETP